jgi:hypothetical protein
MANFKLRSNLEYRKGSRVVFAYAGLTTFDQNGETEVELKDEEELNEFLSSYPDMAVASADGGDEDKNTDIHPNVQENELGKSEDEKNDIGGANEPDISGQNSTTVVEGAGSANDLATQLEALKLPELKQLASDSGFPEEAWKQLKKEELKAYLTSKLQPQA